VGKLGRLEHHRATSQMSPCTFAVERFPSSSFRVYADSDEMAETDQQNSWEIFNLPLSYQKSAQRQTSEQRSHQGSSASARQARSRRRTHLADDDATMPRRRHHVGRRTLADQLRRGQDFDLWMRFVLPMCWCHATSCSPSRSARERSRRQVARRDPARAAHARSRRSRARARSGRVRRAASSDDDARPLGLPSGRTRRWRSADGRLICPGDEDWANTRCAQGESKRLYCERVS